MALEEPKKGGPYTKKEQEDRREQVFKLCFKNGYSAVKIAEILNVNRNTVNDDIKHWRLQLAEEFEDRDYANVVIDQYQRRESQRNRLVEELEKSDDINAKLAIEKLILQIEDKLEQLVTKIIQGKISFITNNSQKAAIDNAKEFVRYILLNDKIEPKAVWSEDELDYHIIKKFKYDMSMAGIFFEELEDLGLLRYETSQDSKTYDVLQFAQLRDYLSEKEINQIQKRLEK